MVKVTCKDCGKIHSVPFNLEGDTKNIKIALCELEHDITIHCDCKELGDIINIKSIQAISYRDEAYILQAKFNDGRVIKITLRDTFMLTNKAKAIKVPSIKKVNAFLSTPKGLDWAKHQIAREKEYVEKECFKEAAVTALKRLSDDDLSRVKSFFKSLQITLYEIKNKDSN